MDRREPELILDQMKTYRDLHARELPGIILNPRAGGEQINLKDIHAVYAIGDGDSLFAAEAAAYAFKEAAGIAYFPLPALEFLCYVIPHLGRKEGSRILVIGISASGGSPVVVKAVQEIRRLYPAIKTVAVCGKDGSALAEAAEYNESAQLEEFGRTPGIRTYGASLAALLSLACSIGEAKKRASGLSRKIIAAFLESGSGEVEKTIDYVSGIGEELAALADGPFISCIGCGPDQGTASFSGAKIVEASGVYAVGQDPEEWNHVESFAYPLDSAMMVFANPGPALKRAASLIHAGKAMGHRVIVVCPEGLHDFDAAADRVIPVFGPSSPWLAIFTQYIPGTLLAYYLAKRLNRAMFMSGQGR
jgi:glucosamine--fructose-6-phosphate aminotransferase (isomerizing)